MKTVGTQLQEARLSKNWTPELAARETKIRVDRLRDLETDDYTHFSSPAYARGFVRTYARALGLDEYKILRQLDNKLPEDDNASFINDSGLPYIPEPSGKLVTKQSTGSNVGLYVVMVLGCGVIFVISYVLFQAYRAGELQHDFSDSQKTETSPATTNIAPNNASAESTPRALPLNSNTAPPTDDTTHAAKALPVDNGTTSAVAATTNAAPTAGASVQTVKALPVNPSDLTNAPPSSVTLDTTNAPRAQAVDPNELTNDAPAAPPHPMPKSAPSARASGSAHTENAPPPVPPLAAPPSATGKRLILTATRDSFVRVTALDAPDLERSLYAAVIHAGQSAGFDGHKFSINVENPSAVNISLDGLNYGPHSDKEKPETFTVESHQP